MNALVLSGGSVKGAFQAGAIKAVLEKGFVPDIIYGVSVGGLNGSWLANYTGQLTREGKPIDWFQAAKALKEFWLNNIRQPSDIAHKKGIFKLGWDVITKNFDGLLDTSPIHELVRKTIEIDNLKASPIDFIPGAVNINSGAIAYPDKSNPRFIDYILASSAIPVMMPRVDIQGQPFLDGGLRDVAPLKPVIASGATKIICILCQAKDLTTVHGNFNPGNIGHLTERLMDIIVNETVNNDIERAEKYNSFLPADGSAATSGLLKGKKRLEIAIIRPEKTVQIDLSKFTSQEIKNLLDWGERIGSETDLTTFFT